MQETYLEEGDDYAVKIHQENGNQDYFHDFDSLTVEERENIWKWVSGEW